MKVHSKTAWFVMATLFGLSAVRLPAQVNWLTDSRFATADGNAQTSPGTFTNYFAMQNPVAPFANFGTMVNGMAQAAGVNAAADASSFASQNSFLTGAGFNFNSQVNAVTGGSGAGAAESCFAEAASSCAISFSVNAPETWMLALDISSLQGDVTLSWNLTSAQNGSILGSPVAFGPTLYEGTLLPGDVYTLTFSLNASQNQPDPIGDSSQATMNATFSIVPEPSSFALTGIGLAVFFMLRKSRSRSRFKI